MQLPNSPRRTISIFTTLLLLAISSQPANAQVTEIVVGVTSTCPYGLKGCWAGAYEALKRLENVVEVERFPDSYNCTATLQVKDNFVPDPQEWAKQFKSHVDQAYVFRGIEVTVEGTLESNDKILTLHVPGHEHPIALRALKHKLQWNSKKGASRQPEPDESDAYDKLSRTMHQAPLNPMRQVQIIGPLLKTEQGLTIEVREFYPCMAPSTE